MTTGAKIGQGVLLKRGDGASPESFTAIAQLDEIDVPEASRDAVESTNSDSTGGWREYIGGLKDGGEFQATFNFIPSNATQDPSNGIMSDLDDADPTNYQLVFPTSPAHTWAFAALVIGVKPAAPRDGKMTLGIKFRISGQPTFS